MDVQRTIIFVSLAIVSYLLVLKWNEDYGNQPAVERNVVVEQTTATTGSDAAIQFDAPSAVNSSSAADAEFETPEAVASVESNVADSTADSHSTRLIEVTTDILKAWVDPVGGKIVRVDMFDHTRSLNSEAPLSLFESNNSRYYVAESGLIGRDGFDAGKNGGPAKYQSNESSYQLADSENQLEVDLVTERDGVSITKRLIFKRNSYLIDNRFLISNQSTQPWRANLTAKIVRDRSADPSQGSSFGMQSYLGGVISTPTEPYEKLSFDDLQEKSVKRTSESGWIGFIQHYFVSAWLPAQDVPQTYQTRVRNGQYLLGFVSPETVVEPGEQTQLSARLYAGPKNIDRLDEAAPNLELTVDYGWLWFIGRPLFWLLDLFHGWVQNWGVAIILVTIVVKAAFYRLSAASYRSMANMRKVAPELTRIKEQYGDDRQKMSQAMMDLYRKEKINPLGGCLPILIQMPVFIALYWVLLESVELRHAPFMLWIEDLSVKDPFFILPILMGASMFIQMQLNPTPPDPIQARVMKMMPIVFTFFFLWFPAGLVLYWLVNNVLSIAQQWMITRSIEGAGKKA